MNRHYTPAEYAEVVQKMRGLFDRPVFTTDVIVGFPGESEEDFAESLAFVQKIEFLKVHVFSYSQRSGTVAAKMPGQIDRQVKLQRSHTMNTAAEAVRKEVIDGWQGQQDTVLLEQPVSKGLYTGYTTRYIPVVVPSASATQGSIVLVTLGSFDGTRCRAAIVG